MSGAEDKVIKIIDEDNPTIHANVKTKGALNAVIVSSVDDSGNTIGGGALEGFATNDVDEPSSTLTYVGKENASGDWLLQKIDASSNPTTIQYATETNNPATTDYSTAFTNRASLTYGDYTNAF